MDVNSAKIILNFSLFKNSVLNIWKNYFSRRSPFFLDLSSSRVSKKSVDFKGLPYPVLNKGMTHSSNNWEIGFAFEAGFG